MLALEPKPNQTPLGARTSAVDSLLKEEEEEEEEEKDEEEGAPDALAVLLEGEVDVEDELDDEVLLSLLLLCTCFGTTEPSPAIAEGGVPVSVLLKLSDDGEESCDFRLRHDGAVDPTGRSAGLSKTAVGLLPFCSASVSFNSPDSRAFCCLMFSVM